MIAKLSWHKIHGTGIPQAQICRRYVSNLNRVRDKRVFDDKSVDLLLKYAKDPELVREVLRQADSIGYTSSHYWYEPLEEQISRFEMDNHVYRGHLKAFKRAKAKLKHELKRVRLTMLQYSTDQDIVDSLPRKDTHAGFEYLITGLREKGEYAEGILKRQLTVEEIAKSDGNFNAPILIGSRTQASSCFEEDGNFKAEFKKKVRLVSMVTISQIVTEMRWSIPVQAMLGSLRWYAGGKNDSGINTLLNQGREDFKEWLSIDYSAYDQTISQWLIREAFELIEELFIHDPCHDSALFKAVVNSFCIKSFVDGKGDLRRSVKGIPSGSMFTQIIGSIINRLMIDTYLESKSENFPRAMLIMGDDNIIFTREKLDAEDLSGYLLYNFGVHVSALKSTSGSLIDDPSFLSKRWSRVGGYRDWKTLVLKLAYPERFRNHSRVVHGPAMVLYSYYLAYPVSMRNLIDTQQFLADYPTLRRSDVLEKGYGLSGYYSYYYNYVSLT